MDDLTIANDQVLWRRIHPSQVVASGGDRPSSGAFDESNDGTGMSASLALPGRDPKELLVNVKPGSGIVSFTAQQARDLGFTLARVPTLEDPHHVELRGKNTKAVRRALARQATWVIVATPT